MNIIVLICNKGEINDTGWCMCIWLQMLMRFGNDHFENTCKQLTSWIYMILTTQPTPPYLVHILSSNRPSSYLFSLSVLWFMWPCSIVYPSPRPFLSSILFSWRLFCCLFCLLPKPLTLPIWSNPSPLHYLSHGLYVFSSRLYCEFSLSLCYLRPLCCIFSP